MVTLDYQIANSANDGYCIASTINKTNEYLKMGSDDANKCDAFALWTGVTIPVGAIITAAYISFYYYSHYNPIALSLYFEDSVTPSSPSTCTVLNAKTKTTNNISFTPASSGTWYNTDSIVSIIQELVDSYDYSAGKAMQMILVGTTLENHLCKVYSYDYTGNARGAKLHIEYIVSVGSVGHIGPGLCGSRFRRLVS